MEFNLFHIGDAHLGYNSRVKSIRLAIEQSWRNSIKEIIAIKNKSNGSRKNYCLICGDLFDSTKPDVSSIYLAMEGIKELSDNDIHTILISGNHDRSKNDEKTSAVSILGTIDKVTVASKEIGIYYDSNVNIMAVPYMFEQERLNEAVQYLLNNAYQNKVNIALFHAGLDNSFFEGETKLTRLHFDVLKDKYDYIALGHYHISEKIYGKGSIYMAGSICGTNKSDASNDKTIRHLIFKDNKPVYEEFIKVNSAEIVAEKHNIEIVDDMEAYLMDMMKKDIKTHGKETIIYETFVIEDFTKFNVDVNELTKKINKYGVVDIKLETVETSDGETTIDIESVNNDAGRLSVYTFLENADIPQEQKDTIRQMMEELSED